MVILYNAVVSVSLQCLKNLLQWEFSGFNRKLWETECECGGVKLVLIELSYSFTVSCQNIVLLQTN